MSADKKSARKDTATSANISDPLVAGAESVSGVTCMVMRMKTGRLEVRSRRLRKLGGRRKVLARSVKDRNRRARLLLRRSLGEGGIHGVFLRGGWML